MLKVFSLFDSKAAAFLPPFMFDTKPMAIRALMDLVSDPQHNFSKHAADFTLFVLAEWDPGSGRYVPFDVFENLGCLLEYKAKLDLYSVPPVSSNQEGKGGSEGGPRMERIN